MKRFRHTPESIIRKLKTAEQLIVQGKTVADVCRALEAAESTHHRWRQQHGAMKAEAEAQGLADRWPTQGVSTLRPHSALQGRTPLEAAQAAAA
jgi:transposase-like protein